MRSQKEKLLLAFNHSSKKCSHEIWRMGCNENVFSSCLYLVTLCHDRTQLVMNLYVAFAVTNATCLSGRYEFNYD